MINQFMMDLKKEQSMSPGPPESQPSFNGYHLCNNGNSHHTISPSSDGVLDLSRRRDSVETRKTPSPYNTSSSYGGSPSTHISSVSPSVGAITTAAVPRESLAISHPNLTLDRTFVPEDATVPRSPAAYPIFYPTAKQNRSPSPEKVTSNYQTPFGGYPNLQIPLALLSKMTPSAVKPPNAPTASELADETSSDVSINVIPNRSPSSTTGHHSSKPVGRDGKPIPRPFKAYPRDPLTIAASFSATDALSAEKYNIFRKRMLEQIHAANGGQPTVSNPKMRRTSSLNSLNEPTTTESQMNYSSGNEDSPIPDSNSKVSTCTSSNGNNSLSPTNQNGLIKDAAYYERRRKNNAAAKKSRDRRRIKEDEIAIRAAFLERENIELKFELAAARKQLALYGVTTTL